MQPLHQQSCEACRADSPRVPPDQVAHLLGQLPGWQLQAESGIDRLQQTFTFNSYAAALAFTQQVGELAEQQDHHPLLQLEWGKVSVSWWTHAIKGLHRNDFVMAAKTTSLYAAFS